MNLEYAKKGNYYIPNIELLHKSKKANIGKYGRAKERFLKEHRKSLYYHLIMKEELVEHLIQVDNEAHDYLERLIPQFAKQENVTEELKNTNQMEWVGRMNNIKNRVEEIIYNEIIYK